MKILIKAADFVVAFLLTIAASSMIISMFLQVVFRFVFNSPLYWTEELSRYSFIYIVFIGAAWAGKQGMHLGVDYFTSKLPEQAVRRLAVIIDLLVLVFSAVIVIVGAQVIPINFKQFSPALNVPMGAVYAAIPMGFLLLFIYYLDHLMEDLGKAVSGRRRVNVLVILASIFIILLVLGMPIAFTMGIACLGTVVYSQMPLNMLITRMFSATDSFSLMAVPFFILAGELMNEADLTDRILNLARALVGFLRGGLAIVNILASVLFAGLSGSATADTAALGSLEIPMMVKDGYSKEFSVAVTVASSTIGPIIPPSVMLVMYAVIASVNITKILIAGIVPGILMALAMSVAVYFISLKRGYGTAGTFSLKNIGKAAKQAVIPMLMPIIIMGGILSGIFTATEAGVVAVVYAFIIGIFVYKTIKLKDIPRILVKGAATTAVSLFIIAMASIFSWFLAWESFPETVVNVMQALTSNGTVALCMVILFLFVLGLFVEGIPVLIVFAPILVPAMEAYGIDTLYFGIVLVLTVLVGSITPPVGSLLYLGSSIAKTTVSKAGKEVWIFVAMIMSVIGLLVIFPQIVLFLPDLLYN